MVAGALTDCMQEKKRAGRFSPKNTMSEVGTDGQTERDSEQSEAGTDKDDNRQEQKADLRAGWDGGAAGTGQGYRTLSLERG